MKDVYRTCMGCAHCVVSYLFLAGLGAGAYITSAFLRWRHPEAHGMRRAGHVIAPIVVAVGLVL